MCTSKYALGNVRKLNFMLGVVHCIRSYYVINCMHYTVYHGKEWATRKQGMCHSVDWFKVPLYL